jgi:hypothetical protein
VAETPLQTLPYAAVVALLLVLAHAMDDYGHLPDGWPELLLATLDPAGSKAGSKEAAEPVRKRPRPS